MKKLPVFLLLTITFITAYTIFINIFQKSSLTDKSSGEIDILSNANGLPAMATGNCNSDSDCFPSGCSSQVCANHEIITTCEAVNFPEKETYACGCKSSRCVWYR